MEIPKLLDYVERTYRKSVKPNLEENCFFAALYMDRILMVVNADSRVISGYRSGENFVGATSALAKEVKDKARGRSLDEPVQLEFFEAMLGQVKLAVKKGNRFRAEE